MFPCLGQTMKSVCAGPRGLMQTSVTTALGSLQILVGLLSIGLGPGRPSTHPGDLSSLGAAYWLGAVLLVTGILSILAGQISSSWLLGVTVFMNAAGAILAVVGVVLYAIDLRGSSLLWMCERGSDRDCLDDDDGCRKVALLAQKLLSSMDRMLIALGFLQLLVNIRFIVVGIKDLIGRRQWKHVGEIISVRSHCDL